MGEHRAIEPNPALRFLAAGLCSLAFLFAPAVQSLRMSVWQACLGIFLLVLAFQGWNRLEQAPTWQRQVCGGLALCVGYHFTMGEWSGKQWVGSAEWLVWVGLDGFVALCFFVGLLFWGFRNGRNPVRLVDLAGVVALWTWSAIALVTYGLLRMAAWREPLWGPPYIPLLLLTLLSAALYSAFRFHLLRRPRRAGPSGRARSLHPRPHLPLGPSASPVYSFSSILSKEYFPGRVVAGLRESSNFSFTPRGEAWRRMRMLCYNSAKHRGRRMIDA